MGRIAGHYEWDDDDLTPGNKKEGGLHQNLFDADGNLKGSARFVPADDEPLVVTETVYIPVEERRRAQERDELAELIADVVSHLARRGLAAAAPVVSAWFRETAVPTLAAQRTKLRDRRDRRDRRKAKKSGAVVEGTVIDPTSPASDERVGDEAAGEESGALAVATPEQRPAMSQAEAQARYLAALAARAFSDEQMRLVAEADIVDGGSVLELERSLAELPPAQLRALLEAMVTNPNLLAEDNLAELASVLGRRSLGI